MHIWCLRSNCEINFCIAFVFSLVVKKGKWNSNTKLGHKFVFPLHWSISFRSLQLLCSKYSDSENTLNFQGCGWLDNWNMILQTHEAFMKKVTNRPTKEANFWHILPAVYFYWTKTELYQYLVCGKPCQIIVNSRSMITATILLNTISCTITYQILKLQVNGSNYG